MCPTKRTMGVCQSTLITLLPPRSTAQTFWPVELRLGTKSRESTCGWQRQCKTARHKRRTIKKTTQARSQCLVYGLHKTILMLVKETEMCERPQWKCDIFRSVAPGKYTIIVESTLSNDSPFSNFRQASKVWSITYLAAGFGRYVLLLAVLGIEHWPLHHCWLLQEHPPSLILWIGIQICQLTYWH